MRGFVFTEFIELVEGLYGTELVDQLFDSTELDSGGAYTAVENYDHKEMARLVTNLSELVDATVPDLFKAFGEQLFGYLASTHQQLILGLNHPFELFEQLEHHVHAGVRKLYPEAETPYFDTVRLESGTMRLTYRSSRAMPDLAEGLIVGACRHFGRTPKIRREDRSDGQGTEVDFFIDITKS